MFLVVAMREKWKKERGFYSSKFVLTQGENVAAMLSTYRL